MFNLGTWMGMQVGDILLAAFVVIGFAVYAAYRWVRDGR